MYQTKLSNTPKKQAVTSSTSSSGKSPLSGREAVQSILSPTPALSIKSALKEAKEKQNIASFLSALENLEVINTALASQIDSLRKENEKNKSEHVAQITELKAQFNSYKQTSEKEISELKQQLTAVSQKSNDLSSQSSANNQTTAKSLADLTKKVNEEIAKIPQLVNLQLDSVKKTFQTEIDSLKQQLTTVSKKSDELTNQSSTSKQATEKSLADLTKKINEEIAKIPQLVNQQLDALKKTYQTEIDSLKQQLTTVSKKSDELTSQSSTSKQATEKSLADLTKKINEEIAKIPQLINQQLDAIKKTYQTDIENFKQQLTSVSKKSAELTSEPLTSKQGTDKRLDELYKKVNDEIAKIFLFVNRQLDAIKITYQAEIDTLNQKLNTVSIKFDELTSQSSTKQGTDKRLDELTKKVNDGISKLPQVFTHQLDAIKQSYQIEIDSLKQQLTTVSKKSDELTSQSLTTKQVTDKRLDDLIKKVNDEIFKLPQVTTQLIDAIKKTYQTEIDNLKQQLTTLSNKSDALTSQSSTTKQAIDKKLDDLTKKVNDEISKIFLLVNQQLNAIKKTYQIEIDSLKQQLTTESIKAANLTQQFAENKESNEKKYTELLNKVKEEFSKSSTLHEQLSRLQSKYANEIPSLLQKLTEVSNTLDNFNQHLTIHQEGNEKKFKELNTLFIKLSEITAGISTLTQQLATSKTDYEKSISQFIEKVSTQATNVDELKKQIITLQETYEKKMTNISQQLSQQTPKFAEFESQIASLKKNFQSEISKLDTDNQAKNTKIESEFSTQLSNLTKSIEALSQEKNITEGKFNTLTNQLLELTETGKAEVQSVKDRTKALAEQLAKLGNISIEHYLDKAIITAAKKGLTYRMDLLSQLGGNLLYQDEQGKTVLHWSAIEGHDGSIVWLLAKAKELKDIPDHEGTTLFHYLASNNEKTKILNYLLSQIDLLALRNSLEKTNNQQQTVYDVATLEAKSIIGNNLLLKVCKEERDPQPQIQFAQEALEKGAGINQVLNKYGETALHLAVHHGYKELVQYLLSQGADPSFKAPEGTGTPTSYAANKPEILQIIANYKLFKAIDQLKAVEISEEEPMILVKEAIENAIELGANINTAQDPQGYTLLHLAIQQENIKLVEWLITEKKASIDVKSNTLQLPLHTAVLTKNKKMIKLLLSAHIIQNISTHQKDSEGKTPNRLAHEISSDLSDYISRQLSEKLVKKFSLGQSSQPQGGSSQAALSSQSSQTNQSTEISPEEEFSAQSSSSSSGSYSPRSK